MNQAEQDISSSLRVETENLQTSDRSLKFDYKVKNRMSQDAWVCDDVDAYSELTVVTKVTGNTLLISLKSFDVPPDLLLEEAIVARYIRLPAGATHKGEILVELPVGDRSPINRDAESVELGNVVELSRAIFELGFFTDDLSQKMGDSVEKGDSEHTVYVGHLWEERHKERTIEAILSDTAIP